MKRALLLILLVVFAFGVGWLASEALYRTQKGQQLVADTIARMNAFLHSGASDELVRHDKLRKLAAAEPVSAEAIEHEVDLLRAQFADENAFNAALASAGLKPQTLRALLAEHLRALFWLEKQVAPALAVSPANVRSFYSANRQRFALPQRFRASHIFVAAPDGSTADVLAMKQSAIQGLAIRVLAKEDFAALAAEASEDEATKLRGGDLGYFSAWRMPPEFIAEVEKLSVGEVSAPIRTHLGFHIVQLTEVKPPRQMSLEEAQGEIALELRNQARAAAVAQLNLRPE